MDYAGHQGGARPGVREHGPDRGHAPRRLQRLPRPQRQPDRRSTTRSPPAPNPNGSGVIRDPFPGNVIPANRLDPVGRNVASIYPLPNGPGNFDNYTSTVNRSVRDHSFTGRIDHRAGEPGQLLRPLQLREVQARRAAGPGRLLPAHARRRGGRASTSGRSWPASRTRASPPMGGAAQLDAPLRAERRQRAAPGLRQDQPRDPAVGLRPPSPRPASGSRASTSASTRPGLPNLNIQDVTGISGGPAFLPVNPKQIHYQVEDTLSLGARAGTRSRRGYRFILRKPTPFTHTNTRSSIAINRNLTNNPQTNSQGSGIATLLLGYTTGGSRGFLLDFYDFTNSEHSAFVQDDWKLSERLTDQRRAALRGLRSRHRGAGPAAELRPRGPASSSTPARTPTAHANKQTRWGNFAPRLGVAWDVTGDAKNVLRAGYGRSFFPVPLRGRATCWTRTCPTRSRRTTAWRRTRSTSRPSRVPRLSNPFPPIVPRQAAGNGRAERGQPARLRPRVLERDAAHGHLAGELRAAAHEHADGRGRLRRQQGIEPHLGRQHQRGPAGAGHAGLAPADPAALQRGHDQLLRHQRTARSTTACR